MTHPPYKLINGTYWHETCGASDIEDASGSKLDHVGCKQVSQRNKRHDIHHNHANVVVQLTICNLAMSAKSLLI